MINDELVSTFSDRLKHKESIYENGKPARKALQDEFNAAIKAEWAKIHPRGVFKNTRKQRDEVKNYSEILKPFMDRANKIGETERNEYLSVRDELADLAEKIEITADMKITDKSLWFQYGSVSTYDYSSQGFGAGKYARDHAQRDLDHVIACGVDAEIIRVESEPTISCGFSMPTVEYKIMAGCTELVCEIVRRKNGLSLREIVKRMWKRGANPRVHMPMLPHGYEESVGIDYFGNDTNQESSK